MSTIQAPYAFYIGCSDIAGLWEATQINNHDFMHGLGDGPYWMISYGYFLALSAIYMLCFVIFGLVLGKNIIIWLFILGILALCLMLLTSFSELKFFTLNDYSIQFVFYFIYVNLQISMAFLLASFFSNVKTATGLFLL
jgi:hypothetical protein